jgi:hypothetical protein
MNILRTEALTLRYMHLQLQLGQGLPVPDLLGYDATMANEVNAPFILMNHLRSIPAHHIWFDHLGDEPGYAGNL